jgi:HSP20 family molecular chaperone IbpA
MKHQSHLADVSVGADPDRYFLQVPIVDKTIENVVVECSNGNLIITGHREPHGSVVFQRCVRVPERAAATRLEVEARDGVLHISAPRKPRGSAVSASVYYRLQWK